MDNSCSILAIILEEIEGKFGKNFRVFSEIWKGIVKPNEYLEQEFKDKVQEAYKGKKTQEGMLQQFIDVKLSQVTASTVSAVANKLVGKYLQDLPQDQRSEHLTLIRK